MKEKRKSRRISFTNQIRYGEKKPTTLCKAYDLSEEGIGIYSKEPLGTNQTIKLDIKDGNKTIHAKGVVRWAYQDMSSLMYKTGIKLTVYPPELTKLYKKLLAFNPE